MSKEPRAWTYKWYKDLLEEELLDEKHEDYICEAKTCDAYASTEDIHFEGRFVHSIIVYRLSIIKRTPKGVWYKQGFGHKKRWRAYNSRKFSWTPREAIKNLKARANSNLRHCKYRLRKAKSRVRFLEGVEV